MLNLTEKEKKKLDIIVEVIEGKKTKSETGNILGLSKRQIDRLITKYKTFGSESFVHQNKGKASNKKIPSETAEDIINLYMTEYYDYNFTHFYEEIGEIIGVSFVTVCNILNEADIVSPQAQHKTIRLYNEKMKKAIQDGSISKEKEEMFEERQKEEKQKHFRRSENLYAFGEQIQFDAAVYEWFGEIVTFLHLAVDRGTKKVLYGWFDYQETADAYYILLMNMLLLYGVPAGIRTDKRGCFNVNNAKCGKSKINLTQFETICRDLEIDLKSSSNAIFKPNVERENRTFKGRLKAELRKNNITTLVEANEYLNQIFIPKMNAKFSYAINPSRNKMEPCNYSKEELNIVVSEKYERKIDNASSFKYKRYFYIPVDLNTGELTSFPHGTTCTVIIAFDKTIWCMINERLYSTTKLEKRIVEKEVKKSTKTQEEINKSKAHKPSQNSYFKIKY